MEDAGVDTSDQSVVENELGKACDKARKKEEKFVSSSGNRCPILELQVSHFLRVTQCLGCPKDETNTYLVS